MQQPRKVKEVWQSEWANEQRSDIVGRKMFILVYKQGFAVEYHEYTKGVRLQENYRDILMNKNE